MNNEKKAHAAMQGDVRIIISHLIKRHGPTFPS